jgi:hypothetical protein
VLGDRLVQHRLQGAPQQPVDDQRRVRLLEATGPRGTRVALVARYARADMLAAEAVFLDAEKALA